MHRFSTIEGLVRSHLDKRSCQTDMKSSLGGYFRSLAVRQNDLNVTADLI